MPQLSRNQKTGGVAAICIAAAGVCLPLTKSSEGERLAPYRDPAHIVTWCYGETQGPHKDRYSSGECAALLENRLARDYAPKIAACVPQAATEQRIKVFSALLDAAYNAGSAAVCKSRMARSIRAGDWRGGCNGFYGWYATARDRRTGRRVQLPGLVARRAKEAQLCFAGLQ